METSTKFSGTELMLVVTNSIISKLFLTYPSAFSSLAASAGIILSLCTVVAGGILMVLTVYLYGKKREDITNILKNKACRYIITVIIIILLIINLSLFVRSVSESIKISLLPSSPLFFISFIFVLGALICSHTGLKAIVRSHSFIVPFTLAMVAILILSSVRNFDFYNIFPIMGNGYGMFSYLWILCGYFADFLTFLLLIPFSSDNMSFGKVTAGSFIISSAVLVSVISMYTLIIPYTTSDTLFIPVYRIAQYINYESFMSRVESIFTVGWLLSFFANASLQIYLASMLTGRIFRQKSNRPAMYVISVLVLSASMIPKNTAQLVNWLNNFTIPKLIVGIILPIIILCIARYKEAAQK